MAAASSSAPGQGAERIDYFALRGALCSRSARACFQNLARAVVPWPAVWSLAGISSTRAVFHALDLAVQHPEFGGLRSSSAELIANRAASMRSRPGEGL